MNFQRIGFASQLEDDERVVRSFRRPFIPILFRIVVWVGVFGALVWGVWAFLPLVLPLGNDSRWLILIVIFFGGFRLLQVFWKWYGNAVLMTNEGLVFAEWNGFFNRKIVRLDYWDLDDIIIEQQGVVAYVARIGDLVFEKVNGGTSYVYKGVSRPKRVTKIIRHHKGRMLDEKNFTEESALRNLLSQMVQTHVRKEGQPERNSNDFLSDKDSLSTDDVSTSEEEMVEVDFELDDDGGIEITLKEE